MRLLPRHPSTMALAILLACLVWYTQARERRERISERQLDAPVTFVNVPPEMVITSDAPRSLVLRVRGALNRLRQLDPAQTGVVIDLRGAGEGQREFVVENRNVTVPEGVEVLSVSPAQIQLRLERLIRRRLPVRVRLAGEPAPGMEAGLALVEPPSVRVSGPRLQLEALQALLTEPVNVDGADGPVEAVVPVRSPNPLIRIEDPLAVRVIVEIVPVRTDDAKGRRR